MDKVNLIYKIDGIGVEKGIDIFELSPILLSYGKLISESYKTLYPDNPDLAINVKPFEKGSFLVDIHMFAKNVFDWTKTTQMQDLKTVIEWLGIVGGGSASVYKAVKKLNGKPKTVEKLKTGDYQYIGENNVSITVNKEVHILLQNPQIQQTFYNGVAKPMEMEGIDKVESYIKKEEDKTKVTYTREDVAPIKNYSNHPIPTLDKEEVVENERKLWVQPKRGSFEGEKNAWSFRIGEDEVITANVLDEKFRDKIKDSKIRLAPSDRLFVRMIEKQHIKGKDLTISRDIVEVINYQRGPEQEEFSFEEK